MRPSWLYCISAYVCISHFQKNWGAAAFFKIPLYCNGSRHFYSVASKDDAFGFSDEPCKAYESPWNGPALLGSATCDGVYLFVGYLASIPKELEEAAYIDGARTPDVFFRVIYPLLKPMISTIVIKNGLWFWNDYLLPSLILTDRDFHTLTLFLDRFKTEYYIDYTLVFAAILLTMLPMLLLYIFMQKQFIGGLTGGAVKG